MKTLTNPKLVKVFSHLHQDCPLSMKMIDSERFISSDITGIVQINKIRKSTFSYGMDKKVLFNNSQGIVY